MFSRFVMSGAMVALSTGCSLGGNLNVGAPSSSFADSASTNSSEAATLDQFKTGFYAFANTQGCVKCHSGNVAPNFASADLSSAYSAAKGTLKNSTARLIDFSNPTASIFITAAGDGHCSDPACSDASVRPAVQKYLIAWANAEVSGGSSSSGSTGPFLSKYLTDGVTLPANLPNLSGPKPAYIRFPLSKLAPSVAALSNAVAELEVRLLSDTEYRVTNLKIIGATSVVAIKGIHVFVRPAASYGVGNEDLAHGALWSADTVMVPVVALPANLPTTTPLAAPILENVAMPVGIQSGSDVLTLGFDQVN